MIEVEDGATVCEMTYEESADIVNNRHSVRRYDVISNDGDSVVFGRFEFFFTLVNSPVPHDFTVNLRRSAGTGMCSFYFTPGSAAPRELLDRYGMAVSDSVFVEYMREESAYRFCLTENNDKSVCLNDIITVRQTEM